MIKNAEKEDLNAYMEKYPYLKGLNPEQLKAVLHTDGPLLILAGAGSGKTRVITLRALHIIKTGLAMPWNILGVTFTNKAAREMKERIRTVLSGDGGNTGNGKFSKDDGRALPMPEFSTFHSFCLKLLRRHADLIGYEKSFIVFDEDDSGKLVSKVIKSLNIDEKVFSVYKAKGFIENNKNLCRDPESVLQESGSPWEKNLALIYDGYVKKLKENNAMDFGDLLYNTVRLFEARPEVLRKYSDFYKYIMVDEFQDTNFIQDRLVKYLAGSHKNICVVGDDDQSIYSFRGAIVDNILSFEEAFPGCEVIKLEKNYRSTKTILTAASNLVKTNKSRKEKTLRTDRAGGGPVTVYQAQGDYSEAYFIAKEIRRLTRVEGYSNKDIAVLYRVNSLSRIIEDRLMKESVKYQIYGGLKFYQRKEIKDILSFLRFAANPKDRVSFERSVRCVPIGAGEVTVKNIENIADKNGTDVFGAYESGLLNSVKGIKTVASKQVGEPSEKPSGLVNYFNLISELRKEIERRIKPDFRGDNNYESSIPGPKGEPIDGLINMIYDVSGYEAMLRGAGNKASSGSYGRGYSNDAEQNRMDNIEELISASQEFDDIAEFLDQSAVDEAYSGDNADAGSGDITKVSLMTLHSAKGLEFPVVFMAGLEEQIFPHARSIGDEASVEEERRLCYVGITRAKEKLYITWSKKRKIGKDFKYNMPSRFLDEIPELLKEIIKDDYEWTGGGYSSSGSSGSRYYGYD